MKFKRKFKILSGVNQVAKENQSYALRVTPDKLHLLNEKYDGLIFFITDGTLSHEFFVKEVGGSVDLYPKKFQTKFNTIDEVITYFRKKYPEIRYVQLLHNLNILPEKNNDDFYSSDKKIMKRIESSKLFKDEFEK